MKCSDIYEAAFPRKPSAEALAKAASEGFDLSKLWFHGTRKRFDGFQLPKTDNRIDELGPGVYLTSIKWLANTWARERGFIVICVIRKGELFDLEKLNEAQNVAMMRQVFVQQSLDSWVGDKPDDAEQFSGEHFDERFKKNPYVTANRCLSGAGYIGAFKQTSQVPGQVVIFKPEDVRIVARHGGKSYMTSDD